MSSAPEDVCRPGPYCGAVARGLNEPALMARLAEIGGLLDGPGSEIIAKGRNRHVKLTLNLGDRTLCVAVKAFGRQPWIKDRLDRIRGSKAARAWKAADWLARPGCA